MLAYRHVVPLLPPRRGHVALRRSIRYASQGPLKKAAQSRVESAKPARIRSPPRTQASRARPRPQDAPPPSLKPAPFSFPSKLAAGVLGGIAVLAGYYTFTVLKSVSIESNQSGELDVDPDAPSVETYDHIAPYFDQQVNSNEWWLGISKLRKQIVGQASGDVLEVGVGTGRNHGYYQMKNCRTITFLDASENMIAIAAAKWNQRTLLPEWRETAPNGTRRVNFKIMSASDTVSPPTLADDTDGRQFTTIVSTFTLCSMPHPAEALAHMCTLLSTDVATEPRVLLLEHGKSSYQWINNLLNNSAPAHAHRYGCWWNRDIGVIAEEAAHKAGMEIVQISRKHFGTTWIVEMRPRPASSVNEAGS